MDITKQTETPLKVHPNAETVSLHYILANDNGPTVSFIGEHLTTVSCQHPKAKSWTEMSGYRSLDGLYIVKTTRLHLSGSVEEVIYETVSTFTSAEKMAVRMGLNRLTSKLFKGMGIDHLSLE